MQKTIDELLAFKNRDKFAADVWDKRGLVPSSKELCEKLTDLFDSCADNLIDAVNRSSSEKKLKAVLKSQLSRFNKFDYDTEEREFICDLFLELAAIVNVSFNDNLSKWLYGSLLTALLKINKLIRPERIVETQKQPCTSCGITLESLIMRKEKGIPDSDWFVVKCKNCNGLNLLSHGPDIKEIRFGNYDWVETLRKAEYTEEQALLRFEQIKIFRKL